MRNYQILTLIGAMLGMLITVVFYITVTGLRLYLVYVYGGIRLWS